MTYVGNIPLEGTTRWDDVVRDLRSSGLVKFHVDHSQLAGVGMTQLFTMANAFPLNSTVIAAWLRVGEAFDTAPPSAQTLVVDVGVMTPDLDDPEM
ncbi:MAG: hypothetical protein NUW37_12355, partial [Planctomycetes bacterium]|nr:hypothetical protein [Planctomycetota bacterium]